MTTDAPGSLIQGRFYGVLLQLHVGVPVGADDVRLLEHRLGRQHDVRLAGRIGQKLVDDHTEVEPAQGLQDPVCLWVLGHRIAALDPGHPQRRIFRRQHVPAEARGRDRHPGDAEARRIGRVRDIEERVGLPGSQLAVLAATIAVFR